MTDKTRHHRRERKQARRRARKARGVTKPGIAYHGPAVSLPKLLAAVNTDGAQRYRKQEKTATRKRRANRTSKEYYRV
jgi:hypothetical protein